MKLCCVLSILISLLTIISVLYLTSGEKIDVCPITIGCYDEIPAQYRITGPIGIHLIKWKGSWITTSYQQMNGTMYSKGHLFVAGDHRFSYYLSQQLTEEGAERKCRYFFVNIEGTTCNILGEADFHIKELRNFL